MDHKQKVQNMKYREGQVEYYGKKGMSVLGTMVVQWVTKDDDKEMGFQYSIMDYIISGYTGQDNVQVCAILQLLCSSVQKMHPDVNEICLQSDNATWFSSQEMIPFIHHLNAEHPSVTINKCIFTEAQTGCGILDTHFSYVNIVLKSYVEDGNDIDMEEDIFKALSYHHGIAGTTVVLVDGSRLKGPSLETKYNCDKMGSRETHELRWDWNQAMLIKSSGVTEPITVTSKKLMKHKKLHLHATIKEEFKSPKPSLFTSSCKSTEVVDEKKGKSSKTEAYVTALEDAGVICSNTPIQTCIDTCVNTPSQFTCSWAVYPGNTKEKMSQRVYVQLKKMFELGHNDKIRKVSADCAKQILVDGILFESWAEKLVVSIPRIKTFSQ